MIRRIRSYACRSGHRALGRDQGAQIVEFAVALPLLVVFVVGIFDFSNAFTLKQRLTNIARDAARASAIDPSADVGQSSGTPLSVMDAFQIVDNYMIGSNLNDCGIGTTGSPSGLTWTFTGNGNGCTPPGLTIIVNRGYYFPQNAAATPTPSCVSQNAGGQTAPLSTCVSIQYAYPWKFGQVSSLLGAGLILPQQISAVAVSLNEN